MRLLAVTVPAADAELVADRCWQAGAAGIWESEAPDGAVVLRAGVEEREVEAFLAAMADLSPVDVTDVHRVELATRTVQVGDGDHALTLEVPPTVFGDGRHPTTAACLDIVARLLEPGDRFLDVGCGSGALSVVAARLGADVVAIDIEVGAVEATQTNAATNGVVVDASTAPLSSLEGPFDVVAANISARAILDLADDLRRVCAEGGVIVASGVLAERWGEVADGLGGDIREVHVVDGWVTAVVAP